MEYRHQKVLNRIQPHLMTRQRSTEVLAAKLHSRNEEIRQYTQLQEKMVRAEEQYGQALRQANNSRSTMEHQSRQMEATAEELRSTIEVLSGQVKSLTIRLNDLLGEADELANLKTRREEEIEELNVYGGDLRESCQILQRDKVQLQSERGTVEGQLRQIDGQLNQLKRAVQNYRERADKANKYILTLQLTSERIGMQIGQFEQQNNAIDMDVRALVSEESSITSDIEQLNQEIKALQFQLSEMNSDQRGLQAALRQTRTALTQEREKAQELAEKFKQKELLFQRIDRQTAAENQQADFLVRTNGEIAEVNNKLQQDLSFCQKHREALMRNNQQLTAELENFRKQDRAILQQIQNRSNDSFPKAKLDESKITIASSRLRASRRLQP